MVMEWSKHGGRSSLDDGPQLGLGGGRTCTGLTGNHSSTRAEKATPDPHFRMTLNPLSGALLSVVRRAGHTGSTSLGSALTTAWIVTPAHEMVPASLQPGSSESEPCADAEDRPAGAFVLVALPALALD